MGSSSTGLAFAAAFLNAIEPAILKAISDESTSWYEPSKTVENSPKIRVSAPAKVQPEKELCKIVDINQDESGEVYAEINRDNKIERVDISTVQRRKGSWKSKNPKTKKGKDNQKEWVAFYSNLEERMKAER